jgi:hypothetical protein
MTKSQVASIIVRTTSQTYTSLASFCSLSNLSNPVTQERGRAKTFCLFIHHVSH